MNQQADLETVKGYAADLAGTLADMLNLIVDARGLVEGQTERARAAVDMPAAFVLGSALAILAQAVEKGTACIERYPALFFQGLTLIEDDQGATASTG